MLCHQLCHHQCQCWCQNQRHSASQWCQNHLACCQTGLLTDLQKVHVTFSNDSSTFSSNFAATTQDQVRWSAYQILWCLLSQIHQSQSRQWQSYFQIKTQHWAGQRPSCPEYLQLGQSPLACFQTVTCPANMDKKASSASTWMCQGCNKGADHQHQHLRLHLLVKWHQIQYCQTHRTHQLRFVCQIRHHWPEWRPLGHQIHPASTTLISKPQKLKPLLLSTTKHQPYLLLLVVLTKY